MSDIHSCSYFCTRPACVLDQRNELRDKLLEQAEPVQVTYAMVKAAEAAHDAARGLQGGFWRSAVPAMIEAALAAHKQAEPVVEPAIPWGKAIGAGCRVCGLGTDGRAFGYVCPRGDCPTQVRSGTHERS